ncbi:MAG: aminotransferase class I/II-fold pyridoxal phosphate-dependent enzyme, partial [Cyclobacteriaceae bacterium]
MSKEETSGEKGYSETDAIRGQADRTDFREHSVPLYLTSSFVFDDAEQARAMFADEIPGNIYSRYSNPNTNEFIEKLCKLEGTEEGIATASGMAAMYSSMAALLKSGDHILACRSVFGSTHQILNTIFPKFGISYTYADINAPEKWEEKIQSNTKMIFVETPSNPALDLIDLEWLGKLAAKKDVILNVDNCFATPYLQNPARWG